MNYKSERLQERKARPSMSNFDEQENGNGQGVLFEFVKYTCPIKSYGSRSTIVSIFNDNGERMPLRRSENGRDCLRNQSDHVDAVEYPENLDFRAEEKK